MLTVHRYGTSPTCAPRATLSSSWVWLNKLPDQPILGQISAVSMDKYGRQSEHCILTSCTVNLIAG